MKRATLSLMALIMMFSIAACGGANESTSVPTPETPEITSEPMPEEISEQMSDSENTMEYAIGEKFGTDSVECIIDDVIWITRDNTTNYAINESYPEYHFLGGIIKTLDDLPSLCVLLSLKNIGKQNVDSTIITIGDNNWWDASQYIYGRISAVYDEGYTFDAEYGINEKLEVLGDPVKIGRVITVKDAVYENEDSSLQIKVELPNSAGDIEEFYVVVR